MTWKRPLAIALSLLALSACAAPGGGSGPTGHSCSDKVAQVAVTGSTPGLWNCLSADFQRTMHSLGHDGDGALIKTPFASSWKYIGRTTDFADYELVLLPDVATQAGVKTIPLTVWLDKTGKVANIGAAGQIY